MRHRTLHLLAALSLAAATATVCRAQDTVSSAQSVQRAPSSSQTTPAAPSTTAKKVWTNDDVGDLREHSEISTSTPAEAKPAKPDDKPAKNRDAKWYHDQLAKLEAQIPPIDRQIANLQAALDGTPTGDSRTSTRPSGVEGGDWRTEMAQLQTKRDDIVAHISAVQDEARHHGIPADTLP
jgi:hypothetical protein